MVNYTTYQRKYFAEQITLMRAPGEESMASVVSNAKIDLTPHQIDAAVFAMHSPISNGALLADEVGLGKTIEAGLVLAQYWAERKRKILLIAPTSLRSQWHQELIEKFFIESLVMDGRVFEKLKKGGNENPFKQTNKVVICSYRFASNMRKEIQSIDWDLAIIDEAHTLRNVYMKDRVISNNIKKALKERKKILLTATPIQNKLLELYGLTSIIDEHIFGNLDTFHLMYCPNETLGNSSKKRKSKDEENEEEYTTEEDYEYDEVAMQELRERIRPYCNRTLRSQVKEFVPYTRRIPILCKYDPTPEEQQLYDTVSDYLNRKYLVALPGDISKRALVSMIIRKLLASSSYAIAGTIDKLIDRLNQQLNDIYVELDLSDFDIYQELEDELNDDKDTHVNDTNIESSVEIINEELAILEQCAKLARSIKTDSKCKHLLKALDKGFSKTSKNQVQKKAVIFTESRRTQEYLLKYLSKHGYDGKIVLLNGSNDDKESKRVLKEWKDRHKNDGLVMHSKTANMKAAIVEEFRDRATILIGTEAAAEGINLQFCNIVVNYDLPWNPQRIEQRIGRCHRYGQKNDVVVINFLNQKNLADVRVYEILDKKFKLFKGMFGASDEVLGTIESGVDFEKKIAAIYQNCRTEKDRNKAFAQLQKEMAGTINKKISKARRSLLENFDEEVVSKIHTKTIQRANQYSRWVYCFLMTYGAKPIGLHTSMLFDDSQEELQPMRLRFKINEKTERIYNIGCQSTIADNDAFLHRGEPTYEKLLKEAVAQNTEEPVMIEFDTSGLDPAPSYTDHEGVISIDKIHYSGISENERLVITAMSVSFGTVSRSFVDMLFRLPGVIVKERPVITDTFNSRRRENIDSEKKYIEHNDFDCYSNKRKELQAYGDDIKNKLADDLKKINEKIQKKQDALEKCENSLQSWDYGDKQKSTSDYINIQKELDKLKDKRNDMEQKRVETEKKIDEDIKRQQQKYLHKLYEPNCTVTHIMTFGFRMK